MTEYLFRAHGCHALAGMGFGPTLFERSVSDRRGSAKSEPIGQNPSLPGAGAVVNRKHCMRHVLDCVTLNLRRLGSGPELRIIG